MHIYIIYIYIYIFIYIKKLKKIMAHNNLFQVLDLQKKCFFFCHYFIHTQFGNHLFQLPKTLNLSLKFN